MAQTPEEVEARAALDAERTAYWQRAATSQRTRIETTKLVATVTLALAGTLVGTALQVGPSAVPEVVSCVLIAIALLAVLSIIALDQLYEPDIAEMIRTSTDPDVVTLASIQAVVRLTLASNEKTVHLIKVFALSAILFATSAACVAAISLLEKQG